MPGRRDLVVNTGPLLALIAAGHLNLLPRLFGRVIVPAEVVQEIEAGGAVNFGRDEFRACVGLEKRNQATEVSEFLKRALDRGEAAVVALATGEGIGTVCIDEALGRRMARNIKTLIRAGTSGRFEPEWGSAGGARLIFGGDLAGAG